MALGQFGGLTPWLRVAGALSRRGATVRRIMVRENSLRQLDGSQLRKASLSLRHRARCGEPLDRLLAEAYALAREAAGRTLGMKHYPVQILGGVALHRGHVAEMQTGEGKTLTAVLPVYLAALSGEGAHLATANDYLARRDAELMAPVYEALGMTVGLIESHTPRPQRRKAYQCDITYSTAKEFGFDFLRDRLQRRAAQEEGEEFLGRLLGQTDSAADGRVFTRQRGFILVDEADSILIDEARTPLVVSSIPSDDESLTAAYRWAADAAGSFAEGDHFTFAEKQQAGLNADGRRLVRRLAKPETLADLPLYDLYEHIERALFVRHRRQRDRHYVVREGEIVIVDEFTGRLAEGRRWREGLHQAVEAKEGCKISLPTGEAAKVTMQDFFNQYHRLAGMTGTAANSARELAAIYAMRVDIIPTNRPSRRTRWPDRVFGTQSQKWRAVVEEVQEVHQSGRPVLIGTRSIDKSEAVAKLLREADVEHQVLNARQSSREAEVVAQAGYRGAVTVATNMAGRGTDILLSDDVRALGGLHVIGTELHESSRIDRQLIGRCGRQGDPGTFRFFLALDDEILAAGLGARRGQQLTSLGQKSDRRFDRLAKLFRRAQARIERKHSRGRRTMLYHERERHARQSAMGLDPYLESPS